MRVELIERNRTAMRRFENCINTNDLALAKELIYEKCGKQITKTAEALGVARNTVRKYL